MPNFPNYHIVPASEWVKLHPEKHKLLREYGGIAVNDAFLPLWQRTVTTKREILCLYGTYGSSKTTDRVQELVLTCITDKYFRCYYGRQVFEVAKKELHSSIISAIERMGLQDLFDYSKKPNGSKVISCKANGNIFTPFGCDDLESIKGWDDPTHILLDEANQIEYDVFGMLLTRLRKIDAKKCMVLCFNNCDVDEDHWICTRLLNNKGENKANIIEHLSLFTDNYFIDQEDYRESLIKAYGDDPVRLHAVLNGGWGAKVNTQPFYKTFSSKQVWNPAVNTDVSCEYDSNKCLWVSFDENRNPYLPVGIFQSQGNDFFWIDEIAAKNPHNTIEWVCGEICRRYAGHKAGMIVTGDATSIKGDVKVEQGVNLYTLILGYLDEFSPEMRVNKSNPNVKTRGNFINSVFGSGLYGLRLFIHPKCINAIKDFKNTMEAPDGNGKNKNKTSVDGVKGVQPHGHFTDLFDYAFTERYKHEFVRFQQLKKSTKIITGTWASPNSY